MKSGDKRIGLICSDGGCRTTGDVCKAFGAGADFVMVGSLFSGTEECDAEQIVDNLGKRWCKFYGMSSQEANDKYNGGLQEYRAAEGICDWVEYKGSAVKVLKDIKGGLRSACTYVGASSLKDFSKCCTFVRVAK